MFTNIPQKLYDLKTQVESLQRILLEDETDETINISRTVIESKSAKMRRRYTTKMQTMAELKYDRNYIYYNPAFTALTANIDYVTILLLTAYIALR